MSDDANSGWIDRLVRAAMKDQISALGAEIGALKEAVAALQAAQTEAESARNADKTGFEAALNFARAQMESERETDRAALETARAADRTEIEAVRAEQAALRETVTQLAVEAQAHAANAQSDLSQLSRLVEAIAESDSRVADIRLRVEGLAAQQRWDAEHLRHALDAVITRMPLSEPSD